MMRKIIVTLVAAIIGGAVAYAGSSNTNYTSAGTVGFRTTTDGTTNCVGTTACNLANVTIWDSVAGANGVAVSAANAMKVDGSAVTQPVSGIVTIGTGGNGIGSVNPTTANNWGIGQVGVGTPTNGVLGMMSNAGTAVALQGDGTNGLWVNIKAGAGSGGTAIADKAAWTVSSTQFTLTGGEFTTGGATACTTGQSCTVAMTADRGMFSNLSDVGGTPLTAAVSAYGTAPTGTAVMGVNAFVTNATAPGSNTPANSSPVVNAQTTPVLLNAITNTSKTIKASAGQLVMLQCGNTNTSEAYVQIYNNAAPTVGTTTPALSIPIAASSTGGFALPGGIQFATAITAAATTTATGGTAPTTALDCNASYM